MGKGVDGVDYREKRRHKRAIVMVNNEMRQEKEEDR